jgi:hypothetical protein
MAAILGPIVQALQPQSIIPPGSQAPSPQQFQQGVQQKLPSKPLAQTEQGIQIPISGGSRNPLLERLLELSKLS